MPDGNPTGATLINWERRLLHWCEEHAVAAVNLDPDELEGHGADEGPDSELTREDKERLLRQRRHERSWLQPPRSPFRPPDGHDAEDDA